MPVHLKSNTSVTWNEVSVLARSCCVGRVPLRTNFSMHRLAFFGLRFQYRGAAERAGCLHTNENVRLLHTGARPTPVGGSR